MAYTSHGVSCFGKDYWKSRKTSLKGVDFLKGSISHTWNANARFVLERPILQWGFQKSKEHYEKAVGF